MEHPPPQHMPRARAVGLPRPADRPHAHAAPGFVSKTTPSHPHQAHTAQAETTGQLDRPSEGTTPARAPVRGKRRVGLFAAFRPAVVPALGQEKRREPSSASAEKPQWPDTLHLETRHDGAGSDPHAQPGRSDCQQ